ncbi:MAG: carbamoyltransferase [Candidatus Duberdicusella sinuisediminis]|nr:MAG: carbamoyltransferase [Candidatus Omnitrophota bacterium]
MNILGIASPFGHDHSACIIAGGKVVAAAEEERFTRKKHAEGQSPVNAIKYCLKEAGLSPQDIDYIAYPWSLEALREKRGEYFWRTIFKRPSRAYKRFFRNRKSFRQQLNFIATALKECGFDIEKVKIEWVEHHIAHIASSYYLSGTENAGLLSMDAGGEVTSTLLAYGQDKKIYKIKEIIAPDSLGNFYSTMTDYLGFKRSNGEYKVMGMAPYGESGKIDLSHMVWWDDRRKTYFCSDDYVWVERSRRYRKDKVYSRKMVEEFGPPREGDDLAKPYIHIARATQDKLEEITLKLVEVYLRGCLEKHEGRLCFSGGVALNVALNRKLLESGLVRRLWVQPASHDAGGSLGAGVYLAVKLGEPVEEMTHVYLGPAFSNREIEEEIRRYGFRFSYEKDICEKVSQLLYRGEVVGWFQGRMEWGPRALGNRSILGNPTIKGTADKINAQIKFREKWRPFCPSILKEFAQEILKTSHPAPFMTIAFRVNPSWQERIAEVVHVDGTCRPQVVEREINPKFYRVIENFYHKTGVPVVINTSLNRRGEPIVCSPKDALEMFKGSGLKYLAIGDFLVSK